MQIHRINYHVRGSGRLADYAIRFLRMITEQAQRKARILTFWHTHGLKATVEAFGVKHRTLYYWQAQLKQGKGQLEALNPKSKVPKVRRRRLWPPEVIQEIRHLRTAHPNLGKDKLHPFLKTYCTIHNLRCPSDRTVGRLIADAPDKMRTFPVKVRHNGTVVIRKPRKKARKPKHFKATYPGHCGSFDTIEKIIDGTRRYVLTFTDVFSRFSLAMATTSHASLAASQFLQLVTTVFPYKLTYVLTDNGSEFQKHFDIALKTAYRTHWHTYPKTPKMNAHVERFNRTVQEEFLDYHRRDLLLDLPTLNQKLLDYLVWYNAERPHWSLNNQSPLQFLSTNNHPECKTWWPHTATCAYLHYSI